MKIQKQKAVNYPYIFRFTAFYVFSLYITLLIPFFFGIKLIIDQEYGFGISIISIVVVLVYSFKDILLNKPQIKVNHLGIWAKTTNFISWKSIEHIEYKDSFILNDEDEIEKVIIIKVKGEEKKKFIFTLNTINFSFFLLFLFSFIFVKILNHS